MIGRRNFISGVIAAAFVPATAKAADSTAMLNSMRSALVFADTMQAVRDTLSGTVTYSDGETVNMSVDFGHGDFTIESWHFPDGGIHHYHVIDGEKTTTYYIDPLPIDHPDLTTGKQPQAENYPKDWLTNPDINRDGSRKKGIVIEVDEEGNFLDVRRES